MNWILSVVAAFFLSTIPAFADQPIKSEVRDASGKLLYKTYTKGGVTETREPSGKLVTKSKTRDSTTEVRSPTGRLLQKVK